ncbi:MAG: PAS domain S-box protein, partial [Methanomassiliicoccales archaeon]
MERIDFKKIVETINDIVYLIDNDGKIVYVNPAIENILGYKQEEVMGKSIFDLMTLTSRRFSYSQFSERIQGKKADSRYFVDFIAKEGHIKRCEIIAQLITWKNGSKYVQGTIRDMTLHESMKNEIEIEKRRLELLIDSAGIIIIELEFDGTITMFNRGAEEIFEYSRSDVIGKNFFDMFVPPNSRQEVESLIENEVRDGRIVRRTWDTTTREGRKISVSWILSGFINPQGKLTSIAIGEDITELQEKRKSLTRYISLLKLLNEISLSTQSTLNPDEVMRTSIEKVTKFFGFNSGMAFCLDENLKPQKTICIGKFCNDELITEDKDFVMELERTVISKNSVMCTSPSTGDINILKRFPDAATVVFSPINGRELRGAICLCSDFPLELSKYDEEFFATLSLTLGYACENAMLYSKFRDQVERIKLYSDILLHDIINYMTPISAYAEILDNAVRSDQSEKREKDLSTYSLKLNASLKKLVEFIENVRILVRLLEQKELPIVSIDLIKSIEEAVVISKERYPDANITMIRETDRPATILVNADNALPHVFLNIITNAIKYSEAQPITV